MTFLSSTKSAVFNRTSFVAAAAFSAFLAGGIAAHAFQMNGDKVDRTDAVVSAYAPPADERFGAFEANPYEGGIEHELNDAWMGMTVRSQEGTIVGYVTDAFVNPDGSIDELVVMPPEDSANIDGAIFVPTRFAKLGNQDVQLTLTVQALRTMEPASDVALYEE